jgi:hypothetical protein
MKMMMMMMMMSIEQVVERELVSKTKVVRKKPAYHATLCNINPQIPYYLT